MKQNKNKAENQEDAVNHSPLTTHHLPAAPRAQARQAGSQRTAGAKAADILRKIFILPIRLYQLTLSPLLGTHCRHMPSCSQYTIEAIIEWGPAKGIWLGMKRISRCHPWGTSGYDPVPRKQPAKK